MTANYKLQCGCMLQDELAKWDELPQEVRVALASSPFGTCTREAAESVSLWGAENYLSELRVAESTFATVTIR